NLGNSIGIALITIITNANIGHTPIDEVRTDVFMKNMHIVFIVFSAICACGIFISLQRKPKAVDGKPGVIE
ncbi:MAG: hypothetical protein LBR00_05425, partial [Clostridiales Family XIII bacterium]|nr:hypothetical protein [Clostridiales Family XIII bacterium]